MGAAIIVRRIVTDVGERMTGISKCLRDAVDAIYVVILPKIERGGVRCGRGGGQDVQIDE